MLKKLGSLLLTGAGYLIKEKYLNSKQGAAFLSQEEAGAFLSSSNKGLLLDGKDKRLSIKESYQNVCLSARVGAGKTTQYIIPNVLDKARHKRVPCSIVVNDPKGEVRDLTSGYLYSQGYNIVAFDLQNLSGSHSFNPFIEAKNEIELEQIAETLIWCGNPNDNTADAYWNNGAVRILSVLIKCLNFGEKKYFNLPNLHHLLQNFGEMGEGLHEWVAENCWNPSCPDDPYILTEWKGALTGNKEAVQSFVAICLTALKAVANRELRQFFSHSDYDFSRLRKEKTVIYLITPPENQRYYSFLTSLFFRSVFNECMRQEHLGKHSLPVYVLYDEFGNSYIPDFASVATTIRGYGVSLSLILQSISQLAMRYGQEGAKTIQGAINTNICLSASDPETANFFSELSGKVRERQVREITDANNDYREYNLLNPNEVRTIEHNEALVISKNRNPLTLSITPYYENRRFRKAAQFPCFQHSGKGKQGDIELVEL
ncbi:MAG: type IV secretory system conjugative DNA transfer family protein [Neptuniibacter sp.]